MTSPIDIQTWRNIWSFAKKRIKQVFPKNVYQLREILFDKLDSFNIPYSDDQKLFQNIATFDFE